MLNIAKIKKIVNAKILKPRSIVERELPFIYPSIISNGSCRGCASSCTGMCSAHCDGTNNANAQGRIKCDITHENTNNQ